MFNYNLKMGNIFFKKQILPQCVFSSSLGYEFFLLQIRRSRTKKNVYFTICIIVQQSISQTHKVGPILSFLCYETGPKIPAVAAVVTHLKGVPKKESIAVQSLEMKLLTPCPLVELERQLVLKSFEKEGGIRKA